MIDLSTPRWVSLSVTRGVRLRTWGHLVAYFNTLLMASSLLVMRGPVVAQTPRVASSSGNSLAPSIAEAIPRLRSAIARIDHVSGDERSKAINAFVELRSKPSYAQLVNFGLALTYVYQRDHDRIDRFLLHTKQSVDQLTTDENALIERIRMWSALERNNEEDAEASFIALVRTSLHDQLEQTSGIANAEFLANLIAIHRYGKMELLPPESVSRAVVNLSNKTEHPYADYFRRVYDAWSDDSKEIEDWIAKHPSPSDLLQAANAELIDLDLLMDEAKKPFEENQQSIRKSKQELRDLFVSHEVIKRDIEKIEADYQRNPQLHNPVQPDRNAISRVIPQTETVDTGRTREVETTRRVRDDRARGGYREEKEKRTERIYETRRRSQSAIDRDIDAIYLPLKQNYDHLMAVRNQFFTRRMQKDADRRQNEQEAADKRTNLNGLEREEGSLRQEVSRLERRALIARRVRDALESGGMENAFRPPHVPLFQFDREKQFLLSRL
jgi:hypothetical protein